MNFEVVTGLMNMDVSEIVTKCENFAYENGLLNLPKKTNGIEGVSARAFAIAQEALNELNTLKEECGQQPLKMKFEFSPRLFFTFLFENIESQGSWFRVTFVALRVISPSLGFLTIFTASLAVEIFIRVKKIKLADYLPAPSTTSRTSNSRYSRARTATTKFFTSFTNKTNIIFGVGYHVTVGRALYENQTSFRVVSLLSAASALGILAMTVYEVIVLHEKWQIKQTEETTKALEEVADKFIQFDTKQEDDMECPISQRQIVFPVQIGPFPTQKDKCGHVSELTLLFKQLQTNDSCPLKCGVDAGRKLEATDLTFYRDSFLSKKERMKAFLHAEAQGSIPPPPQIMIDIPGPTEDRHEPALGTSTQ